MTLSYGIVEDDIGAILVAVSSRGLRRVAIAANERDIKANMATHCADQALWHNPAAVSHAMQLLAALLRGETPEHLPPLDIEGTAFEWKVWNALRRVPFGSTVTYTQLASLAGVPAKAVRAVANACGRNPLALFIPCHRALRKDGSLGGYYWGTPVKHKLLVREKMLALRHGEHAPTPLQKSLCAPAVCAH